MLIRLNVLLCGLCVLGCAGSPTQHGQRRAIAWPAVSVPRPGPPEWTLPPLLVSVPAEPIGYEVPSPPLTRRCGGAITCDGPEPAILFELSLHPGQDRYSKWLYVHERQDPYINARFVDRNGRYRMPPN